MSELLLTKEEVTTLLAEDRALQTIASCLASTISQSVEQTTTQLSVSLILTLESALKESLNALLEQRLRPIENKILYLTAENSALKRRMADLEAKSRSKNLVIYGLTPQYTESHDLLPDCTSKTTSRQKTLERQVISFCKEKLGLELQSEFIESVSHPRYRNRPIRCAQQPTLVCFSSKKCRDLVFAARTKLRRNKDEDSPRFYIFEHLTAFSSQILAECRKLCYEKKFTRSWTFEGRVFIKVTSNKDEKPTIIDSLEHRLLKR